MTMSTMTTSFISSPSYNQDKHSEEDEVLSNFDDDNDEEDVTPTQHNLFIKKYNNNNNTKIGNSLLENKVEAGVGLDLKSWLDEHEDVDVELDQNDHDEDFDGESDVVDHVSKKRSGMRLGGLRSMGSGSHVDLSVDSMDERDSRSGSGEELEAGHKSRKSAWSPKQDGRLSEFVRMYGCDWGLIADLMESRYTAEECEERYNTVLKLHLKKGQWEEEEDKKLVTLVHASPKLSWSEIAALIPGRSAKQCRERWSYNLDPRINKTLWTPSEDKILMSAQAQLGNRWAQIAALLPGRTENAVKTRFKSIIRAKKREWTIEEDNVILDMQRKHGSQWDLIADALPKSRTKNAVKTRFRLLVKGKVDRTPELGAPNQIFFTGTNEVMFDGDVMSGSEMHVKREQKLIEQKNMDDLISVNKRKRYQTDIANISPSPDLAPFSDAINHGLGMSLNSNNNVNVNNFFMKGVYPDWYNLPHMPSLQNMQLNDMTPFNQYGQQPSFYPGFNPMGMHFQNYPRCANFNAHPSVQLQRLDMQLGSNTFLSEDDLQNLSMLE